MKKLKASLIKLLKWLIGDTRQEFVSRILGLFFVSGGSFVALSKTALNILLGTVRSPTPIWATIIVALVIQGYIYLKIQELLSKNYHAQRPPIKLSKDQENILMFLSNSEGWEEDSSVAASKKMTLSWATYHLNELSKFNFIEDADPGVFSIEMNRRIIQDGRKYLVDHGLLIK